MHKRWMQKMGGVEGNCYNEECVFNAVVVYNSILSPCERVRKMWISSSWWLSTTKPPKVNFQFHHQHHRIDINIMNSMWSRWWRSGAYGSGSGEEPRKGRKKELYLPYYSFLRTLFIFWYSNENRTKVMLSSSCRSILFCSSSLKSFDGSSFNNSLLPKFRSNFPTSSVQLLHCN